jgi:hypothetical protein
VFALEDNKNEMVLDRRFVSAIWCSACSCQG